MPYIESREVLYDRINKRVDLMVEQGLVEETRYLLKNMDELKNFVCTIGYKEVLTYIDGEAT